MVRTEEHISTIGRRAATVGFAEMIAGVIAIVRLHPVHVLFKQKFFHPVHVARRYRCVAGYGCFLRHEYIELAAIQITWEVMPTLNVRPYRAVPVPCTGHR